MNKKLSEALALTLSALTERAVCWDKKEKQWMVFNFEREEYEYLTQLRFKNKGYEKEMTFDKIVIPYFIARIRKCQQYLTTNGEFRAGIDFVLEELEEISKQLDRRGIVEDMSDPTKVAEE